MYFLEMQHASIVKIPILVKLDVRIYFSITNRLTNQSTQFLVFFVFFPGVGVEMRVLFCFVLFQVLTI